MSPSPPSASLAEALASGDLASAIRFLDRAVEAEERKLKEGEALSSTTPTTINGIEDEASSSSSSSARLANALTSRALCHERLGMLRKALKDCDAALAVAGGNAAASTTTAPPPLALRLRPRLLLSLGRGDEAREGWRACLEASSKKEGGDGSDSALAFSAELLGAALEAADALNGVFPVAVVRGGGGASGGEKTKKEAATVSSSSSSTRAKGEVSAAPAAATAAATKKSTPTPPATPPAATATTTATASFTVVDVPKARAAAARAAAAAARAPGGGSASELGQAIFMAASLARDAANVAATTAGGETGLAPPQRPSPQQARSLGTAITALNAAAVEAINAGELSSALALLDALVEGPVAQLCLPLAAGTPDASATASATPLAATSPFAAAATGTRVARGTARALSRDVEGAVEDFTAAIRLSPGYADSWKRRAQARAALASGLHHRREESSAAAGGSSSGGGVAIEGVEGRRGDGGSGARVVDRATELRARRSELLDGALSDLAQAARLLPRGPSRADVLGERAFIHRRRRDLRRAALDLQKAVDEASLAAPPLGADAPSSDEAQEPLDRAVHARLWLSLGMSRVGLGEIDEAVRAYERAMQILGSGEEKSSGGGGGSGGERSGEKGKKSGGSPRPSSPAPPPPPPPLSPEEETELAVTRAEVLSHLMHALKEGARPAEARRAYQRYLRAAARVAAKARGARGDVGVSPTTVRLYSQMLAGCGDLQGAIEELELSVGYRSGKGASPGSSSSSSSRKGKAPAGASSSSKGRPVELRPAERAESLVALGGFYHAAGRFGAAQAAYEEATTCAKMVISPSSPSKKKKRGGSSSGSESDEFENAVSAVDENEDGDDFTADFDAEDFGGGGGSPSSSSSSSLKQARRAAALAYYQRETLRWLAERVDEPAAVETCLDGDLGPLFKEGWCKKSGPDAAVLEESAGSGLYPPRPPVRLDIFVRRGPHREGEEDGGGNDDDGENGAGPRSSSAAAEAATATARGGEAGTSSRAVVAATTTSGKGVVASSPRDAVFLAGRVDVPSPLTPDVVPAQSLEALLTSADAVGALMQYDQPGFLPNLRTRRAAGLAAIEAAQLLRRVADSARNGRDFVVRPRGASHPSGAPRACGWRDAADVAVRWRQLAEPGDTVLWVDRLSREEFEAGFGSHTPMFSGQTACVRYAGNAPRAIELFAECAALCSSVMDVAGEPVPVPRGSARAAAVAAARTPRELLAAVGCDAWVAVPIDAAETGGGGSRGGKKSDGGPSTSSPRSTTLDGTRLTITAVPGVPDGAELSIRTPVTPARWEAFSRELDAHFDDLTRALARNDATAARAAGAKLSYYWFSFMPLARGSSSVGLTLLLAVGLACGMPATGAAPRGRQVDWEAILSRTPAGFARVVVPWLWPSSSSAAAGGGCRPSPASSSPSSSAASFDPEALPAVSTALRSFRMRIAALNRGIVG